MTQKDKDNTVDRYLRGAKKMRSREEEKRIADNKRARGPGKGRAPRRRDWDEEDDDFDMFENMRSSADTDLSGIVKPDPLGEDAKGEPALLVAPRGRTATVRTSEGEEREVEVSPHLRSSGTLVVGDEVVIEDDRITGREERRSELARRDGARGALRILAANVDVGVIVLAAGRPRGKDGTKNKLKVGLVDRMVIALRRGNIEPVVLVNKIDLIEDDAGRQDLEAARAAWSQLGLEVISASAATGEGVQTLAERLTGKTAVFVGQSGVGKSSLLNGIDPSGERDVRDIRDADGRGRHTTTASTLRELPGGTRLVDTPGVRSFGLGHVGPEDLWAAFPDLFELSRDCRFSDCGHGNEPGCAVIAAAEESPEVHERLESWRRMLLSLEEEA